MVEIARVAQIPNIGAEYNAFLYATMGVDPNGNAFSVLSAMARMNLDPWHEAASLAALSGSAATRKLTALIAALPVGPSELSAPDVIAGRLVKLLPSQSRSILPPLPPHKALLGLKVLIQSPTVRYLLFALIALALVTVWSTMHRAPPAPPNSAHISQTTQPSDGSPTDSRS
jgi:hypothetical protein